MESAILGLVLDSSLLIAAERRKLTVAQGIENNRDGLLRLFAGWFRMRGRWRHGGRDALVEHFQVMREVGEPIPEPRTCRLRGSRRIIAEAFAKSVLAASVTTTDFHGLATLSKWIRAMAEQVRQNADANKNSYSRTADLAATIDD